jgi:hypothetical protein
MDGGEKTGQGFFFWMVDSRDHTVQRVTLCLLPTEVPTGQTDPCGDNVGGPTESQFDVINEVVLSEALLRFKIRLFGRDNESLNKQGVG